MLLRQSLMDMLLTGIIIHLASASVVLGSKPGCSTDEEAMTALSHDTNKFGWSLFKKVIEDSSQDNVFLSPMSISAAFGMLYPGTKDESAKELKAAFFPMLTEANVASAYLSLMSKVVPSFGQFKLSTANGAFIERSAGVLDSYINHVKKCFNSEVREMDFLTNSESEREALNAWVSRKTEDRIKDLFRPGSIGPDTALVLANAIYFKADWLRKFSKSRTSKKTFFDMNDANTKTDMMEADGVNKYSLPYYEDPTSKIKMIELPYTGKETSMIIILPGTKEAYKTTEKQLSAEYVSNLRSKMIPMRLSRLVVPKWKEIYQMDLATILRKMNVTSIFSANSADLSGITGHKGLFVTKAIHKAFVKVNEEGTEAAAATGIVISVMSSLGQPPAPEFIANRPFIYVIWHKVTKTALFIGRYMKPN